MTTIDLICTGAAAFAQVNGILTHEMVGVMVNVQFDSAWIGLTPRFHVVCADVEREMTLNADKQGEIPWECMIGGERLIIGIDGWTIDGELRIPTEWANCGYVKKSAALAPNPAPTPDIVTQILIKAQDAEDIAVDARNTADEALTIAQSVREDADNGLFDGHSPFIGKNMNWWEWDDDAKEYRDSGVSADITARLGEVVLVQNEQPTSDINKIWVKPDNEEIYVPEWSEFGALSDRVLDLERNGTGVNMEEVIQITEQPPHDPESAIWVKPTSDEISVPEWSDHKALEDRVKTLEENGGSGGGGSGGGCDCPDFEFGEGQEVTLVTEDDLRPIKEDLGALKTALIGVEDAAAALAESASALVESANALNGVI